MKDLLTTINPEWVEAETFGRYNKHIPKHILQFEENGSDLIVPRGLLFHLLNDLGVSWEIQDERVAPLAEWPEGNLTLRPNDQEPAVKALMAADNGFLSAPAGSGKTVMGLELCRRLGYKALWLTHQIQLKDQAIDEANVLLGIPKKEIGVIHGNKSIIGAQLTVGMIPTLRQRDLSQFAGEFGTVVVDEAHHVPSTTFLKVIKEFKAKHLYGLTATAYRRDKLDSVMFNCIGPKVFQIEHTELIEDEHLIIPTVIHRSTGWCPNDAPLMGHSDFMEAMVSAKSRNQLIVGDVVKECVPGNSCIILVERTKHAEILNEMLLAQGVASNFVVGSVDTGEETGKGKRKRKKKKAIPKRTRETIIEDFKTGKVQALVATYDLLMEGFNYKPLNRLFLAAPIKYKGNVVQALGRIQRPSPGKENALAYDYIDEDITMFLRQAEHRENTVYRAMGIPVLR